MSRSLRETINSIPGNGPYEVTSTIGGASSIPRQHSIQPLHDRVVVILDEFKERSTIITPDIAKEKPRMGVVEAAGPGRWIDDSFYHTQVKPGQRVLLSPGVNVDYDDIVRREGRVVVQEADIMGVLSQ